MEREFGTFVSALDQWGKYVDVPYKRSEALAIFDRFVERIGPPRRIFIIASDQYLSVEWVVPMMKVGQGTRWAEWDDAKGAWHEGTAKAHGRRWMLHLHPGFMASRFQWDATWPRATSHAGDKHDYFWHAFPDFEGHSAGDAPSSAFRPCGGCTMPVAAQQRECDYCGHDLIA